MIYENVVELLNNFSALSERIRKEYLTSIIEEVLHLVFADHNAVVESSTLYDKVRSKTWDVLSVLPKTTLG